MKIQAILFDLDGTLIDQFEAIHKAFSRTLLEMGFPEPSFEQVKRAVGGASESTMQKLIGRTRAAEGVVRLRPIFERVMLHGLKELPGATASLNRLRSNGISCAVMTNKHGPHARTACNHLGLNKFLEFVLGANDTPWKKPDPKLTRIALNKIRFNPSETLYVGDSPYDYETAKLGGLPCRLIASGTHEAEELRELADEKTLVYPDLISLVDELLPS